MNIKCPKCESDIPIKPLSAKHKVLSVRCAKCDIWVPIPEPDEEDEDDEWDEWYQGMYNP